MPSTRQTQREPLKPIATTVDNACCLTGLGRTKLYELISDGTLQTTTIGRRRLVLYSSIEELVQGRVA